MRKLLYATTALTTAGWLAFGAQDVAAQTAPASPPPSTTNSTAAQRIKLGLSGYFQQWAVFGDQGYQTKSTSTAPSRYQQTNFVRNAHNSEVCVIGQTTLDNGLTIGINVQIEANTEADTIDESYLFIQSPTLGQLIVGDENNAGYLLHVTAPDGGLSLDSGDFCNLRAWEMGTSSQRSVASAGVNGYGGLGVSVFDTPSCTTNLRINDNDSGKFTYITPRFAGFQAGISYIPNFTPGGGDNNSALPYVGTGDNGRSGGINNGWAGGVNYTEKFGDVGVQLSSGAMWGESFSGGASGSNSDLLAYNVGAQFSFAGFSLGGAWLSVPQGQRGVLTAAQATSVGGTTGSPIRSNGQSWTVGAAYEFGPYKVGLDYMNGTNNKTTSGGSDRLEQAVLSGTYVLGPGIRFIGGVFAYDWQEENRMSQNQGVGGITGFKLAF